TERPIPIARAAPWSLAAIGMLLFLWSWMKWADPIVDFGRELYVPWQLTQHRVLYRDIAYFGGALPPYVNASWFLCFGVGIRTLVFCNAAVLVLISVLLWNILSVVATRLGAWTGVLALLTLFGFNQLVPVDNYNFICPYSHGMTYGTLLLLTSLGFLIRYLQRPSGARIATLGFSLGLLFLTKSEFFVAGVGAALVGLGAEAGYRRDGIFRRLALCQAGLVLPVLGIWALLSRAMPPLQALRGILGEWFPLFTTSIATMRYYRWSTGFLDVGRNFRLMVVWGAAIGVAAAIAVWLDGFVTKAPRRVQMAASVCGLAVVGAAGCLAPSHLAWFDLWRALPLLLLALAFTSCAGLWNARDQEHRTANLAKLCLAAAAFLLLLKMLLYARTSSYGFALAMPGAVLVLVAGVDWFPAWARRRGCDGLFLRGAALGIFAATAAAHLLMSRSYYAIKINRVGQGPDEFYADRRGRIASLAMGLIGQSVQPGQTLMVFPEGIMLNYLARVPTPSRYLSMVPGDLIMFGERRVEDNIEHHAPDYVMVIQRNDADDGLTGFGADYGLGLRRWIDSAYEPVAGMGPHSLARERFNLEFLRKKTGVTL
ncbi:MAG TPA: hypothetical protein VMU17_01535, partial [Elusimicrobiota bacterium]|nr:hypothetical protein [Elusimicrobiota bacterium]